MKKRARDFANHEMLEESLEPVVRSTAKSIEAITKELIPIKEGITTLNAKLQSPTTAETETKSEKQEEKEELKMYEKVMQQDPESNIDADFGISLNDEKNGYLMGDKVIELSGNDIVVDGVTYMGTLGLWFLILRKKPNDLNYTEEDMKEYKKLVKQTNLMTNPQNLRLKSKLKSTCKWRNIFKEMEKKKEGHGIEFLPSDIISLQQQSSYFLAEYQADNKSATRNQVVAIVDNLLKQKHNTKAE